MTKVALTHTTRGGRAFVWRLTGSRGAEYAVYPFIDDPAFLYAMNVMGKSLPNGLRGEVFTDEGGTLRLREAS